MASYSVLLKPSVEKDLRSLSRPVVKRVWSRVETLAEEPLPRQSTKLAGAEHLYRLRVGEYRIAYPVDHPAKTVIIQYVRHRSKAYR